jgi:hypothetical protein
MAIKSLSIRIDDELLNKLHIVANYEGRSANSQILILIRDCVQKYEEKQGKIEKKLKKYYNEEEVVLIKDCLERKKAEEEYTRQLR